MFGTSTLQQIHRSWIWLPVFVYKAKIQTQAYFEPFWKFGSSSSEPGAYLLWAENSVRASKPEPRLVPPPTRSSRGFIKWAGSSLQLKDFKPKLFLLSSRARASAFDIDADWKRLELWHPIEIFNNCIEHKTHRMQFLRPKCDYQIFYDFPVFCSPRVALWCRCFFSGCN